MVLPGAIIGRGIVIDVVVDMALVNVGTDKELVFALRPAHSGFIADPVSFLRGYLSRLERLAYLEEQRPTVWLPARFGLVLAMHQQELRMCRCMVTEVRGHSTQLLRVKGIFKPFLHGLDSTLVCCFFVRLDVGCSRRRSSFLKNMAVTDTATAFIINVVSIIPIWKKAPMQTISCNYNLSFLVTVVLI